MMNTTMAPMEQIRQTLGEVRRRHDSHHEISGRRIEDRIGHIGIERRNFRNGNNNNKNNDDDNNDNDSNRNRFGGGSNDQDDKDPNDKSKDRDFNFNFFDRSRSSSTPESTARPVESAPAPTVLVEPTPVPPPEAVPTSALPLPNAAPTLVSPPEPVSSTSPVPSPPATTTSSGPSTAAIPNSTLADTSTQPRKELSDAPTGTGTSSSIPTINAGATMTISALPEAETALSVTSAVNAASPSGSGFGNNTTPDTMSPLAERLLIAAGAIGAFIIILAAVFFILRMRNKDAFLMYPKRKFRKSRSGVWYGRRRRDQAHMPEAPPRYSGEQGSYEYSAEAKSVPSQREMEAFFSPKAVPSLATPARAAALSSVDSRRKELVRKALPDQPAKTEMFYNTQSQKPAPPHQSSDLSKVLIQNGLLSGQLSGSYNNTGNQNTLLTQQLSESYNNTGTQVTLLTRQTTDIHHPNQREANRMSYLSSLSSGFGDGLIIPESGATIPNAAQRQSRNQRASRFSWQTSSGPRTPGMRSDRNSIYTTSSVESTPRFRTVNSWVAQQTGRVEKRQKKADEEVPNMPAIPTPLQIGTNYQQKEIDHSAFQQHPGDEVELAPGSRVPSSILDKKIGANIGR